MSRYHRPLLSLLILVLLGGCAAWQRHDLNQRHGTAEVRERIQERVAGLEYHRDIQPIFDKRCVICHACYDSPCQLNLTNYEGLDRGASQNKVYDGARLLAANLSRLLIDAGSTAEWRQKNFHPVLNERRQTAEANRDGSVLYRLLQLKQEHPLPKTSVLDSTQFDFGLDRAQQCPRIEDMPGFEKNQPLWGMPFGLPGLNSTEYYTLSQWIEQGSPVQRLLPPDVRYQRAVADWEAFFNQESLKGRLVGRYLFEHLFQASLHFSELPPGMFYRMVRSRTPSGQPIQEIASRRPFDDPGTETFHYRLQWQHSSVVAKRHMPYALDSLRRDKWQQWFFDTDYDVNGWPGYAPTVAANPFVAFRDLPVRSRYRFLLDEAHFTIDGFIKGPVCRGQVALNVIDDRFWVFFVDPDHQQLLIDGDFLARQSAHLSLPAERDSTVLSLGSWRHYSQLQQGWLIAKGEHFREHLPATLRPDLKLIWDGDGDNGNAALTVFRHFDSATVSRGLIGTDPRSAWLIDYSLLERIHYLLVAGFDVYGNVGHQLITRLYMDFLRMEGENAFLFLLPEEIRHQERALLYREVSEEALRYVDESWLPNRVEPAIQYRSDKPRHELLGLIKQHLADVLDNRRNLDSAAVSSETLAHLNRLSVQQGSHLAVMPEMAVLTLKTAGGDRLFTLLRNSGYKNLNSLFNESQRRLPAEDTLTVTTGITGAYPNAFFRLHETDLPDFVAAIAALQTEADYRGLMDRFGVRRTATDFWQHSDRVHALYRRQTGLLGYGLLDYNRLENR